MWCNQCKDVGNTTSLGKDHTFQVPPVYHFRTLRSSCIDDGSELLTCTSYYWGWRGDGYNHGITMMVMTSVRIQPLQGLAECSLAKSEHPAIKVSSEKTAMRYDQQLAPNRNATVSETEDRGIHFSTRRMIETYYRDYRHIQYHAWSKVYPLVN